LLKQQTLLPLPKPNEDGDAHASLRRVAWGLRLRLRGVTLTVLEMSDLYEYFLSRYCDYK
jgi:hypothetical protein